MSEALQPAPVLPWRFGELAFFFDLDGTLIDIAPRPDVVVVPPAVPHMLRDLVRATEGAVAIVSGRPIAQIDGLLAPARLAAGGLHGAEIRFPEGESRGTPPEPALTPIRTTLSRFVANHPALLLEDKGSVIGVHYRSAPSLAAEVDALMVSLVKAAGPELALQRGKMVIEIRPAAANKGKAVLALMAAPPFRGRRPVAFGDDLTDEDMFGAVNALGGTSVRVGGTPPTQAGAYLQSPAKLVAWLSETLASATGEEAKPIVETAGRPTAEAQL